MVKTQHNKYVENWKFTREEKEKMISSLTQRLPALRAFAEATQDEISIAIGISRQTYNAIETRKRKMNWNVFISLMFFFDYNPSTKEIIRQLGVFPDKINGTACQIN